MHSVRDNVSVGRDCIKKVIVDFQKAYRFKFCLGSNSFEISLFIKHEGAI
tara:strand:+ start:46 stop:195 length:150 start_codon:yes stop_codon:yes gene_type:complete